jgi:prepilin-type N-terminal cleavage/methylation domain-containing protein
MSIYPGRRRVRGFTLVELLVVIAIIAILAALLFPVFIKAKRHAVRVTCISNLRQCATALRLYQDDYDDYLPNQDLAAISGAIRSTGPRTMRGSLDNIWIGKILPYLKSDSVIRCPEYNLAKADSFNAKKYGIGFNSQLAGLKYNTTRYS